MLLLFSPQRNSGVVISNKSIYAENTNEHACIRIYAHNTYR